MHRLMDIKDKLEVIESALNKQYPHFRGDPEITELVTELKDFVQGRIRKYKNSCPEMNCQNLKVLSLRPPSMMFI